MLSGVQGALIFAVLPTCPFWWEGGHQRDIRLPGEGGC